MVGLHTHNGRRDRCTSWLGNRQLPLMMLHLRDRVQGNTKRSGGGGTHAFGAPTRTLLRGSALHGRHGTPATAGMSMREKYNPNRGSCTLRVLSAEVLKRPTSANVANSTAPATSNTSHDRAALTGSFGRAEEGIRT